MYLLLLVFGVKLMELKTNSSPRSFPLNNQKINFSFTPSDLPEDNIFLFDAIFKRSILSRT
jgi:hypothetical protein